VTREHFADSVSVAVQERLASELVAKHLLWVLAHTVCELLECLVERALEDFLVLFPTAASAALGIDVHAHVCGYLRCGWRIECLVLGV
jgi:hypothetical protein